MQLFWHIRVVEHVHCDLLAFLKAKQWPWELPVVVVDEMIRFRAISTGEVLMYNV